MKLKITKIGKVVIIALFLGTALLIPAGSVNVEQNHNNFNAASEYDDLDVYYLDRSYLMDSEVPSNLEDNDDAGYKRDVGNDFSHSYILFPNEVIDDWPGRGNTGKLSSSDKEDWYYFAVCIGQDIDITMTPSSGYNFDISLWDSDENLVKSSTYSGSSSESLTFTADETNDFYFQVKYISGTSEGRYSFDVILNGQNDANFGNDAGNDFISATSINPGTYNGFLDMNDEEDWYKFNVNSGQGINCTLSMKKLTRYSDFDIYLYNPSGSLVYYRSVYYDDMLLYKADASGQWRIKIKIYPGWTDIPQPTEWYYFAYGSGPYELKLVLEGTEPDIPNPIPQPQITSVAQTFHIADSPGSNVDDYGYLASIPACNYLNGGKRYLAPIIYNYDSTPTNWYGNVDDTTGYLLSDWNTYLASKGKTAVDYYVNSDPVKAAAEIATTAWDSSSTAVVAIDGSVYEDTTTEVIHKSTTLARNKDVQTIPSSSTQFIELGGLKATPMTFINSKWGAVTLETKGSSVEPFLMNVFPHYMTMTTDWWPEFSVTERTDTYYPLTVVGATPIWAVGIQDDDMSKDFDLIITKLECDRYMINVDDADSVITAELSTTLPSDLIVFLIDPAGNVRAPDIPDWNGGPINPIHNWNGIDDPDINPLISCDNWKSWTLPDHTYFTAEVLHPEKGEWTAIVVPRYAKSGAGVSYTLSVKIRETNQKRADATISAANAAVIASQEHIPLLYVTENSVPAETQAAFTALGVNKVIFVQRGNIGSAIESSLPTIQVNLKNMQEIVNKIKSYSQSENYITITSLKTGEGFFAPASMLAAYHCSPVLRIEDAPENPAAIANKIDTFRLWKGDYYHGNRAPGYLPKYTQDIEQMNPSDLLAAILKYLADPSNPLPPWGLDADRFWNTDLHDAIESYIQYLGLDKNEKQEAYCFVAPKKDIRLETQAVMTGLNSYAGQIPGDTPAYTNDIVIRNILYPALIYANPNRDVTTTQFMNFEDSDTYKTNDGKTNTVITTWVNKNAFMSHGRTYEGHTLWNAHLKRMNDGASVFYYCGHGTGGSGMSSQYLQTDYGNYPEVEWYDAWRGYMYDSWRTVRDTGRRWYNPEPTQLYDIVHYKWVDQLLQNLKSNAIFYMSCSTGQQFGPMVYLDHGAVMWYGNAGSGLSPQADLLDDWFFNDSMINGLPVGESFSKYVWLHQRDYTLDESDQYYDMSMYGPSTLTVDEGITTVQVIYGDPELIVYSPEWTSPTAVNSNVTESNNQQPLAPTISGSSTGKPSETLTFNFKTTDPNNDKIYYYVNWGDGSFEDWSGPFNSGEERSVSHTYLKGVYNIKIKARDEYGATGPWGTHQINIVKAKTVFRLIPFNERMLDQYPIIKLILTKLLNLK